MSTAYAISPKVFRAALSGASTAATRKRAPVGARVKYTLSEAATVTFTVIRLLLGRQHAGECQKPSRANRRGKPCTRRVSIGSFRRAGRLGVNTFRFTGRVGDKSLTHGDYRLIARAVDAASNRSTTASQPFQILR